MPHFVKEQINKVFIALGIDVIPHTSYKHIHRLRHVAITRQEISLVIEAGAGVGGDIIQLRKAGYSGRVVSFEPMQKPYRKLTEQTSRDPAWTCRNQALGSFDGSADINVSRNSVSSSLLPITETQTNVVPETDYVGTEHIQVMRLDSLRKELIRPEDRIFLKLDVQGFEKSVLEGAAESLRNVQMVECEMSLVPLYVNAPLYMELIEYFRQLGFTLVLIDRGFCDYVKARQLQMDCIFVREVR